MSRIQRFLAVAACLVPQLAFAQAAAATEPVACGRFLGSWSGTWSQGFYGTQWIHVTDVSADCVAQVAYSPWASVPLSTHPVPVRAGAMEVFCNSGTGGTCRLELQGAELWAVYKDPSGFVNTGVFRKDH